MNIEHKMPFSSLSFAQVPSTAEEGEPRGAFCLRCLHLLRQGRRELGYGKSNGCDTGGQLLKRNNCIADCY